MAQSNAPFLVKFPPPVLFGITFVVAILLGYVVEWTPEWIRTSTSQWIGWTLTGAGMVLAPMSAGLFGLRRTTLNPAGHPTHLVTSGAFRISRNPMYLSLIIAYLGLGLALSKILALILVVVPFTVVNYVVIPFEEARMRDKFGETYARYCDRVRRWL